MRLQIDNSTQSTGAVYSLFIRYWSRIVTDIIGKIFVPDLSKTRLYLQNFSVKSFLLIIRKTYSEIEIDIIMFTVLVLFSFQFNRLSYTATLI